MSEIDEVIETISIEVKDVEVDSDNEVEISVKIKKKTTQHSQELVTDAQL